MKQIQSKMLIIVACIYSYSAKNKQYICCFLRSTFWVIKISFMRLTKKEYKKLEKAYLKK